VYGTRELVEGHSYAYWNMAWARFEWEPGGAASPFLHPKGCKHTVVGRVVFLPGPGKDAAITCTLAGGRSVFLPTASGIWVKTSKKDTNASLRKAARSAFSSIKVVDVSVDGKHGNARQLKLITPFFLLRPKKGSPLGVVGSRVAVQAGYHALLRPLSTGRHTVAGHVRSWSEAKPCSRCGSPSGSTSNDVRGVFAGASQPGERAFMPLETC
jgi:hypothetical protein